MPGAVWLKGAHHTGVPFFIDTRWSVYFLSYHDK